MKKLQKNQKGFTIIEVLIVLAIAGLIMLIVFLAVPALQRNSRNTAIRNDAGNVLSGVSEFVANNNGQLPTTINVSGTDVTISGPSGTSPVVSKVRAGTGVAPGGAAPAAPGSINIAFNTGCNGNSPVAKNRAVAALFKVESGSTPVNQCVES
ncbi:type II secretion system GspH family protein [Candidatus Parcubacteria bacterium]|nr:type II secretion system GspH family protein [Candidatus Parcubacteria bacterium]